MAASIAEVLMHRRFLSLALLPALLAFAGCASMRPLKVQPEQLQQVRTVAIVGYDSYLSQEVKGQVDPAVWQELTLRSLAARDVPSAATAVSSTAQSLLGGESRPYDRLGERLEKELGWKVLSRETVTSDPVYARLLATYRHAPTLGSMGIPGVLGGSAARSMTVQERVELMRSLGVDALVSAQVSIWADSADPALIAAGAPLWARLDFAAAGAGPEPLWADFAHGKPSATLLPGLITLDNVHQLAEALDQATQHALDVLVAHQKEACAKVSCLAPAQPPAAAPEAVAAPAPEAVAAPEAAPAQ